jgi:predicted aldo/keto reductase-like oxidoreductase
MSGITFSINYLPEKIRQDRTNGLLTIIRLGTSGLKISKIVLGTMSYGSSEWQEWVLNEEDAFPLLEHAYNKGINTWDTVCTIITAQKSEFKLLIVS